jgi:hypothetical protein
MFPQCIIAAHFRDQAENGSWRGASLLVQRASYYGAWHALLTFSISNPAASCSKPFGISDGKFQI